MTEATVRFLQDAIEIVIQMMPFFVCLKTKKDNKENIAAATVYIWVIVTALQALYNIEPVLFSKWQMLFLGVYFLAMFVFFEGSFLVKAFLYVSEWLAYMLMLSVNVFVEGTFQHFFTKLSSQNILLINLFNSLVFVVIYFIFCKKFLKKYVLIIFDDISHFTALLLLLMPLGIVTIIAFGKTTIFQNEILLERGIIDIYYFVFLCVICTMMYVTTLFLVTRIITRRRVDEELKYAKELIIKEKENYQMILDYLNQIRTLKHDIRYHIHALANMNESARQDYIKFMEEEYRLSEKTVYCDEPSINSLLQEYKDKTDQYGIRFDVNMGIPFKIPVEPLSACVVIGNLLQNALEACLRVENEPYIAINARLETDGLRIMVLNSYDGQINTNGRELFTRKKVGGLGLKSLKRILTREKDEINLAYDEKEFKAFVFMEGYL